MWRELNRHQTDLVPHDGNRGPCGQFKEFIVNVDKMMSQRWASISASPSKDGEAVGIFRGYSLVKQQTQQPQLHLLLWLHIHTQITSTEVFVVFL